MPTQNFTCVMERILGNMCVVLPQRQNIHLHRGTSLTRNRPPIGPYRKPMPRVLGGSYGRGRALLWARYPWTACHSPCPVSTPPAMITNDSPCTIYTNPDLVQRYPKPSPTPPSPHTLPEQFQQGPPLTCICVPALRFAVTLSLPSPSKTRIPLPHPISHPIPQ